VEEEIPPSWQLTGAGKEPTTAGGDEMGKGEVTSHFANHLAEEHLELLFDIRQRRTTRCMVKASSINDWTCCSRHSRMLQCRPSAQHASNDSPQHTPFMDIQVLPWNEAAHPKLQCFVNFSHSIGGLIYHDDKLDFTHFVCIILSVMAALNKASPRLGRRNWVPANTCNSLHNFCIISSSHGTSKLFGATCSSFPSVEEQVATKCHGIIDI
jgi:hypothetical protein